MICDEIILYDRYGVHRQVLCEFDCFFFFKQKTAYELRISDWSSDVCSSDLSSEAATKMTANRASAKLKVPKTRPKVPPSTLLVMTPRLLVRSSPRLAAMSSGVPGRRSFLSSASSTPIRYRTRF